MWVTSDSHDDSPFQANRNSKSMAVHAPYGQKMSKHVVSTVKAVLPRLALETLLNHWETHSALHTRGHNFQRGPVSSLE